MFDGRLVASSFPRAPNFNVDVVFRFFEIGLSMEIISQVQEQVLKEAKAYRHATLKFGARGKRLVA